MSQAFFLVLILINYSGNDSNLCMYAANVFIPKNLTKPYAIRFKCLSRLIHSQSNMHLLSLIKIQTKRHKKLK